MIADLVDRPVKEMAWSGRRGRIEVYLFAGGPRLASLLWLTRDGGILLLNTRLMASEGRRVAIGWALAVAEDGADGYHAILIDG